MLQSDLHIKSIEQTHDKLRKGEITVESLVKQCLDAVQQLNPKISAVLAINSHVIEDARRLDVGGCSLTSRVVLTTSHSLTKPSAVSSQRAKRTTLWDPNPGQRSN